MNNTLLIYINDERQSCNSPLIDVSLPRTATRILQCWHRHITAAVSRTPQLTVGGRVYVGTVTAASPPRSLETMAAAGDEAFVWLRPATEMEELFDAANRKGLFVTVYSLTLRSVVPLTEAHIKEALLHTFRKVASLRTCFRSRGDTLWACDMNREDIKFQMTETKHLVPAIEALLQYHFPTTEGPLWCARLLPADAPGRCCQPDATAAFPHSRTLLLANHHGIADGTTNMVITNTLLNVLDDMMAGKPIDDAAQVGRRVAGEETKALLTAKMEQLTKEGRLHQIQEDLKKAKLNDKLIPRVFPKPLDPDYKPEIILRDLDQDTTQAFFRRCKKEGVTVNSGLMAVFKVGLVDFVREEGLELDSYPIRDLHTISMRRYWAGDTSGTLGVNMMPQDNSGITSVKWRDTFWDYARDIHKKFSQGIKAQDALLYVMDGGTPEEHLSERPMPECDYGCANMGNANQFFPTQGDQVRLGHLVRVTSCWNDPAYHMFHTLHGCYIHSLTYANDILSREKAQRWIDVTFDNLKEVTNM